MSGRIATLFALVPFLTIASTGEAQTRIEKTFSDWLVTCQETEVAKTCLMSQTLTDSASKQMALVWVVNKGADGSTKAMVHTPLGVLLPEGLKIQIGGVDKSPIPFRFCGPRACTAEFSFGDDWLAPFRKETELTVSFMSVTGQPIDIKVSLKGFSAAYDYFVAQ